ncbi:MAG: M20 family metallopeptidase [FCB group bacterium]|jgi:amidohydrolase|nr:M20 family metallopeptidase [FCB group bacterium]
MDTINHTITDILPELIELRHAIHRHPEIRFEEHQTSDRIAHFLDEAGVPYKRGYAKGTGIVAVIEGNGPKTVALRADIDALEIQEQTGLPFASEIPNRMHACGHDGHTTCLCGAAKVLMRHRDQLHGTVKLIFQPAEEQAAGGRFIVQEGVLEGVDAVFALHAGPSLPLGTVGVRDGWLMASADWFQITIHGIGCHGADPGAGVDPVLVAAHIVTALQSIVSREIDPWHAAVVTIATINAGHASNIIPDTAQMTGTYRSFRPEIHEKLRDSIRRITENVATAFRATATIRFGGEEAYPALYNDERMTQFARETITEALGPDALIELPYPIMAAEDFSYYLQAVPGSFMFLGTNPNPDTQAPSLHSPRFDFGDATIPHGVKLMSSLALRFLSE